MISTVGLGIVPRTDAARLFVIVQMALDLVLIVGIARSLVFAAKIGARRRQDERAPRTDEYTRPGRGRGRALTRPWASPVWHRGGGWGVPGGARGPPRVPVSRLGSRARDSGSIGAGWPARSVQAGSEYVPMNTARWAGWDVFPIRSGKRHDPPSGPVRVGSCPGFGQCNRHGRDRSQATRPPEPGGSQPRPTQTTRRPRPHAFRKQSSGGCPRRNRAGPRDLGRAGRPRRNPGLGPDPTGRSCGHERVGVARILCGVGVGERRGSPYPGGLPLFHGRVAGEFRGESAQERVDSGIPLGHGIGERLIEQFPAGGDGAASERAALGRELRDPSPASRLRWRSSSMTAATRSGGTPS